MSFEDNSWRGEAWCPDHKRIERIQRVRTSVPMHGNIASGTYQATVSLECGASSSIVSTARNLAAMGAVA